jgi:hypothetical protein
MLGETDGDFDALTEGETDGEVEVIVKVLMTPCLEYTKCPEVFTYKPFSSVPKGLLA